MKMGNRWAGFVAGQWRRIGAPTAHSSADPAHVSTADSNMTAADATVDADPTMTVEAVMESIVESEAVVVMVEPKSATQENS